MHIPKRWFHVSQEINNDPEMWWFTSQFGERAIRTWLQILVYLDKTGNEWRVTGDWLGTLSRVVRQTAPNVSGQLDWMTANGWLRVRKEAADGSPLIFETPNWSKYNRRLEQQKSTIVSDSVAHSAPFLSYPSPIPSPSHTLPTPKEGKDRIKKDKSSDSAVPASRPRANETLAISISAKTWDAYSGAYKQRYGTAPVRNVIVNTKLKNLVKGLGEGEAPQVAAFYLTHNRPLYVTAGILPTCSYATRRACEQNGSPE